MAGRQVLLGLALTLVAVFWAGTEAQSNDCTNVLISMSPCLNYISGNSSAPSAACCMQLRTVVGSQPQCLCQVLNGGASNLGLNINQTQALAMPAACNVQTPPTSQCDAGSPPASRPDSASRPNSGNTNSGGGSEIVPPAGNGSSDANPRKFGVSLLFSLFLLAHYVSSLGMA